MKKVVLLVLIMMGILIIFPIIYNFVLLWEIPFDISIIEDGAPAIWLSFGGSLIAACSSFVMAYVAYAQNKEIRDQNIAKVEYETALKQYEQLEKFIRDSERLISYGAFEEICSSDSLLSRGPVFLKAWHDYKNELNRISSLAIKLLNDNSDPCAQYKDRLSNLFSLVHRLSDILYYLNDKSFDSEYSKFIKSFPIENGGMSEQEKFLVFVNESFDKYRVGEFHELGFKYQRIMWEDVMKKLETIKK